MQRSTLNTQTLNIERNSDKRPLQDAGAGEEVDHGDRLRKRGQQKKGDIPNIADRIIRNVPFFRARIIRNVPFFRALIIRNVPFIRDSFIRELRWQI